MVSAGRNFKNIFPRPLFIIIFRPEMLEFHPYSILTKDTRVEFVIYCLLSSILNDLICNSNIITLTCLRFSFHCVLLTRYSHHIFHLLVLTPDFHLMSCHLQYGPLLYQSQFEHKFHSDLYLEYYFLILEHYYLQLKDC